MQDVAGRVPSRGITFVVAYSYLNRIFQGVRNASGLKHFELRKLIAPIS